MTETRKTTPSGAIAFGAVVCILIIFVDIKFPALANWSDYSRLYYRFGRQSLANPTSQPDASIEPQPAQLAGPLKPLISLCPVNEHTSVDSPACFKLIQPLTSLPLPASRALWHLLSLASLAFSTFLITRAAAFAKRDEEHGLNVGWVCLTFAPLLVTLLMGQLSLVFGLLPLSIGFYCLVRKKPAEAGLVWSLLLLKPAFLIVAISAAVGQTLAKRNSCAIALAIGLPIIAFSSYMIAGPTLFNAYLQDFAQFSRQTQLNSNLDITFAHAALSVNPGHEVGMGPVMHLISWMIAIGAFSQVALLAKNRKSNSNSLCSRH